jgi:hypothetical protein
MMRCVLSMLLESVMDGEGNMQYRPSLSLSHNVMYYAMMVIVWSAMMAVDLLLRFDASPD